VRSSRTAGVPSVWLQRLSLDTGTYLIELMITNKYDIENNERLGELELMKIMEGYLNTELFNGADYARLKSSNREYNTYTRYEDLKEALPQNFYIPRIRYVAPGFAFQDIKYTMINEEKMYYLMVYTFKNAEGDRILFCFRNPENSTFSSEERGIVTKDVYMIQAEGGVHLQPLIEKGIQRTFDNFNAEIYMQYKKEDPWLNKYADYEMGEMLQGVKY
jgi:hypothetical protein